ncbi:Band 7 domain-containing protein [Candidatus Electronema halotolerans]|jgi:regulator of protease activity HflC (stomatin/prohibitin superfamily)
MSSLKSAAPRPKPPLLERLRYSVRDNWLHWVMLGLSCTIAVIILWNRMFIWIEAGEAGVMYRPFWGGTETVRVYPEGFLVINPFNTMAIYDARVQIIRHEFDVLTSSGLPVTLKLAVRYRPIFELLGVLHQRIGPDYPNKIILPQIESVLRKGLGVHVAEDIYTNKGHLLTTLVKNAIDEVGQKYVIVDDIIIREIVLPKQIKDAIEEKLVHEQVLQSYVFRLETARREAEKKEIESLGIQKYAENISKTMDDKVLHWHGVQATLELASSPNAKVVIIGGGKDGLPLMLNAGDWPISSSDAVAVPLKPEAEPSSAQRNLSSPVRQGGSE